jgi:deoxyribodipyrimidine photo-lyase
MTHDVLAKPSALPPFPTCARSFLASHENPAFPSLLANLELSYDKRSTIPYRGGEESALQRLSHYAAGPIRTYKRDALSGLDGTSHLSPFLAVGALSARQVFWAIHRAAEERGEGSENSYRAIITELLWRDYWKFLARGPMADRRLFALHGTMKNGRGKSRETQRNEWCQDPEMFDRWKEGRTGIPFIDANMRELAATGMC